MKVFLTGGTGFIGGEVARRLRERGDDVVALVRAPGRAEALSAIGCTLVAGSLSDTDAIARGLDGADAAIHSAAVYEVGILPKDRPAMFETNVTGTRNVLTAALDAGTNKVVYVSTVAAFGDTRGEVVDETYEHPGRYTSYYDETKHLAHLEAKRLIAAGLPCVIVQPGAVYGPRDHSVIGDMVRKVAKGRLPAMAFPGFGVNAVHRDDVAIGILLALDAGRTGEAYVLGGDVTRLGEVVSTAARLAGRKPPRLTMPVALVKAVAPFGRVVGPLMGYPPNMRELVSTSNGVTFWATDAKAREELGYAPRGLEDGLRDTLNAEGLLR
ncbi:MAG TPA: NAD-dependent epimerase/dehydratase family protein [Frankiaceae bacterium]|jgi:dihydroflavonol-4-reductase|nr:NAD-dependent epimerase/dehydratase family protein [Frankiaceae bacterium]